MNLALQYADTWMPTEASVIADGLRHRDFDVLDALIEKHQHRLFRYLLLLTGDRPLAEDLFQETWIRVLERGRQYNPAWKFESWLISIARNLSIDHLRRKSPLTFSELTSDDEGPVEFEDRRSPSPDSIAQQSQEAATVNATLATLPAHYREAVTLRFHEEMSLEEIATATGVPLSTAKSRLHRGLLELERRMTGATK